MNILYLTHAYLPSLGGVQTSVHNLADEFVRRGHHIFIVTDGARPFALQRDPPASVLPLRIPYPFHRTLPKRGQARLLDAVNLASLVAVCLTMRIHLAHCHLINVDTRYAVALKRLLGIRMVITLRGGELHHWIADWPVRRRYVRRMLESADAVTALSRSQIDDARRLAPSLPPDSLVIPNPADPDAIGRKARRGKSLTNVRSPYIVFAGRLEGPKRVELLIDAYHGLVAEDPSYPFDLLVVGSGSCSGMLHAAAMRGAGAARIRFLGACSHEDSLALIRDAAMLVLPSLESEGCPNVVLEAMALGTPVVVSDHGPLMELVTHGVNGELFASGDAAALKARLLALAKNPHVRQQYAVVAREYLERRHRVDQAADRYEELYRQVLRRSAGRRAPDEQR
jgi:glycosyltransferase involved in cell wall biosynthesis